MNNPGPTFILGRTPPPERRHEYNAFGIHKGFGEAYADYYRQLDELEVRLGREATLEERQTISGRSKR